MGTSDNPVEIEDYYHQGKQWIANQLGSRDIFTEHARMKEEQQAIEHLKGLVKGGLHGMLPFFSAKVSLFTVSTKLTTK
jgi:hypothetical protein